MYPGDILKKEKEEPATDGPCSLSTGKKYGYHWNIKNLSDKYYPRAGSISSCPCCVQTVEGEVYTTTKYRVH